MAFRFGSFGGTGDAAPGMRTGSKHFKSELNGSQPQKSAEARKHRRPNARLVSNGLEELSKKLKNERLWIAIKFCRHVGTEARRAPWHRRRFAARHGGHRGREGHRQRPQQPACRSLKHTIVRAHDHSRKHRRGFYRQAAAVPTSY